MKKQVFEFPQNAYVGATIPKNKIYERAAVNSKIKNEFISNVENIIHAFELSKKSINLAPTKDVPIIEVLQINLRNRDLSNDVLLVIDKAMPRPIIFEFIYNDEIKQIAAYKRPNEAGGNNWVLDEYYETEWQNVELPREKLPNAIDLGFLYKNLIQNYIGQQPKSNEAMPDFVARLGKIKQIQREIDRLSQNAIKQKQANKQVEINAKIRALKFNLANLI